MSSLHYPLLPVPSTDPEAYPQLVHHMFGIPVSLFDPFAIVSLNKKTVSLVPRALLHYPRHLLVSAGIILFHTRLKVPKLSTPAARLFGHAATRMCIDLPPKALQLYIQRQTFPLPNHAHCLQCNQDGFIIIRAATPDSVPLGLAKLHNHDTQPFIESLFPKSLSA